MSYPRDNDDRPTTAASWDDSSEATQIVRPGNLDHPPADSHRNQPADPFSNPMPAVAAPPVGAPISGSEGDAPSNWSSSPYSDQPAYSAQPAMTSIYPPSTPGYAPSGYPPAYAAPTAVPPPGSSATVAAPASRVVPGLLSALIGLILTAGGLFLAMKYGLAAAESYTQTFKVSLKYGSLCALGAVLLFAAVGLNGWSPWSTLLPGLGLAGLGGWGLFSLSAQAHITDWVKSVIPAAATQSWVVLGILLVVGLLLLGGSLAALLARASGKRDGGLIAQRAAQRV